MKICSIVGARPQFIKIAPLVHVIKELHQSEAKVKIEHSIIHTGQHYDYKMNKVFFDELGIPEPDYNLEVGSGPHGQQTGEMLNRTEKVLRTEKPDWTLVYGDTNSTLAGALAASKLSYPLVHVEAGLRSYNKRMPEEINRVLIDHCSDILFCPTNKGLKNLEKEGFSHTINWTDIKSSFFRQRPIPHHKFPLAVNLGDIMYDALLLCLEVAERKSTVLKRLKLEPKNYFLATVHRAENTDEKDKLKNILDSLSEISKKRPVIFPIHPRTKKALETYQMLPSPSDRLQIIDPVSYFDMLLLEKNACKILTDSGGIQKEAYILQVPCVTLRDETEWVETVESGLNILSGQNSEKIIAAALKESPPPHKHESLQSVYGDGKTAERIIKFLIG